MILPATLELEWLRQVAKDQKIWDIDLLEKAVRALLLLEGLAEANIPFTFKGGTALMLLLGGTKRLSIDIDVLMPEESELDGIMKKIAESKQFVTFEHAERTTTSKILKRHYRFYFTPLQNSAGPKRPVLLDIVFEKHAYSNIQEIDIASPFLITSGAAVKVSVPSVDDILADKLTAFAPNTTGIPYKAGKEMEIIKQLFDIGSLFDKAEDAKIISATFKGIAEQQMGYRDLAGSHSLVLDDIITTALHLCTRGKAGTGDFKALQDGIKRIRPFIFSIGYSLDTSFVDAAKAAYLSSIILSGNSTIERYKTPDQVLKLALRDSVPNILNKIKKISPEAFFYWCKASENLEGLWSF